MTPRPHPPALPHGEIREVFPDVFFVTGTIRVGGMSFSRNMTIVREGARRLILVNSVRLGDEGLKQLDALGRVTDVVRLAAFHGMDDPFYKERYGARTWTVKGQRYVTGFDTNAAATYHVPDMEMHDASELPIAGAKLYVIGSTPPEGLLLVEREGGILISGDCLQNWGKPDAYFSLLAKAVMRVMGFIKPHSIGPAWRKQTKPPASSLRGILNLPFDHVLPAHGELVKRGAKEAYRPRIDAIRDGG